MTDACACDTGGDCECFCTAVAAYAQACSEFGVCVSWRTPSVCREYHQPTLEERGERGTALLASKYFFFLIGWLNNKKEPTEVALRCNVVDSSKIINGHYID